MRDTVLEQYLAKMGFLRDDYIKYLSKQSKEKEGVSSFAHLLSENPFFADKECMAIICFILTI